jgi:ribosomal protein S18 acetylase RimI-like enzyme
MTKQPDSQVVIREIQPADYSELEDFLYLAMYLHPGKAPYPREIIYEPGIYCYCQDFGNPRDCGVVAEVSGRIVAMAWSRFIKTYGFVDEQTPEIAISVLPEYRGRSIGGMLLDKLHMLVAKQGCRQISLAVDKLNPAIRLYRRKGYQTVDENAEDYIMVKELTGLDT